jgi:hypothetical protein
MRLPSCIVACAVVVAAVAAAPGSAAPGAASFALIPEHYDPSLRASKSYFVAETGPGQTYKNSIRISNLGRQTGTALLYAVDATTGQTSGAVYLDRTKPRHGVGGWVTLGASSVTLAPGQSKIVPVTVHVPAGAKPGDHLGGIVAENEALTSPSGKGALQIKIRHLTIAAVLVQVPGKSVAEMQTGGVIAGGEHGYQYVYVHLENTGSVATKPTGRLQIFDPSGEQVASRDLKLDTFVPGTAIDYPVLLPAQALQPGKYTAKVDLSYAAAAIGYRHAAGASHATSGNFPFEVTTPQYKAVFKGVPPLHQPQQATRSGSSGSTLLLVLAGALGALLVVGVVLLVAVRRWAHR